MKVGSVGGIGVYIHWSFWLLMAVYFFSATTNYGMSAGLYAVAFIAGVFGCVVAHEFGHAAAAARYGIPTADITLLPIGGVARLARLPETPVQELVIAVAGPAVNVVIAILLFLALVLGISIEGAAPWISSNMGLVEQLIAANLFLVVFNMLPAFPMDGGRVLRSLLAMRYGNLQATEIAARVGRWMALGFAILAFTSGPLTLLLVAGFIFIAGTAELMGVRMREMAKSGSQPFAGFSRDGGAQSPFEGQAAYGQQMPRNFQFQFYQNVWPQDSNYYDDDEPSNRAAPSDVIDAEDVRKIE